MNKEKTVKELFEDLFKENVKEYSKYKTIDEKGLYFGEDYKEALTKDMEKQGVYDCYKDLEFKDLGLGRTKICKITSSSRLCYIYFSKMYDIKSNPENWVFEDQSFTFKGDNGRYSKTHFDFRDYTNFYECKCEEFFETHDDYLVSHFYKNLLKESFELEGEIKEKDDKLFPTLRQFGINRDGDIYSLHFDVRQLLTHLLSLGNRKTYEYDFVTLTYIWFIPKTKTGYWDNDKLESFDCNIHDEFSEIINALPIKKYCFKHGIILKLKAVAIKAEQF